MASKAVKRLPATEVKNHFGKVVEEVAETDTPVVIQRRGKDKAVIISLREFQKRQPKEESQVASERERIQTVLREAGLLSKPTIQEVAEKRAFAAEHSPEDQERILAEWRELELDPPLSEIVLRNRERELD